MFVGCYGLATSTVISRRARTCNTAHSWWFYSADPLGDRLPPMPPDFALYYPNIELTSPWPIKNSPKHQAMKWQAPIFKVIRLNWLASELSISWPSARKACALPDSVITSGLRWKSSNKTKQHFCVRHRLEWVKESTRGSSTIIGRAAHLSVGNTAAYYIYIYIYI